MIPILRSIRSSAPLDDFLSGSSSHGSAETVREVGVALGLSASLLLVGGVAFLIYAHEGRRAETLVLVRAVGLIGVALLAGGALELVGLSHHLDIGAADVATRQVGISATLRTLGGLAVVLGLLELALPIAGAANVSVMVGKRRWRPRGTGRFVVLGAALAAVAPAFDGHTVTRGPRVVHAAVNILHTTAAGVWTGGVAALLAVTVMRRSESGAFSVLVVRFSAVATAALVAVAAGGVVLALLVLGGLHDPTDSEWGRRLLIKLVGVVVAAAAGAYNHYVLVPAIDAGTDDAHLVQRIRTSLVVEAIGLVFVVSATLSLVNGSTTA